MTTHPHTPDDASDDDLIARALAGDVRASVALRDRHSAPLDRFVAERVPIDIRARQIAREAMAQALAHPGDYVSARKNGTFFKGWLREIAFSLFSDLELIAAARDDERALTALHDRHQLSVFGFVRVRERSDADAEEITQQSLTYALRNLKKYDSRKANFRTWLRVIALSKLRTHYRRLRRDPLGDWTSLTELLERHADFMADVMLDDPDLLAFTESGGVTGVPSDTEVRDADFPSDLKEAENVARQLQSELVNRVCQSRSAPVQLLAYIYVRELNWKPKLILQEKVEKELSNIVDDLSHNDWRRRWRSRDDDLQQYLDTVRALTRMTFRAALINPTTGEVYAHLAAYAQMYRHLLDDKVGETLLDRCFATTDRGKEITRWWEAVFKRVEGW